MCRCASGLAALMSCAVSSAVAASAMALPRLLRIFSPSVPSRFGAADSSGSGTGKNEEPAADRSLKRLGIARVRWKCGSRSLPTGAAVRQHLVVSDEHDQLTSGPLEPDPVRERAEVMTEVQRPGRPVPGGDPEPRRVGGDQGFELSALALLGEQGLRSAWIGLRAGGEEGGWGLMHGKLLLASRKTVRQRPVATMNKAAQPDGPRGACFVRPS